MENKNLQTIGVLILGIFLGYIFFGNITNDVEITKNSDTFFEKREKCANYRDQAKIQLDENYKMATSFFYDIFYTPKLDTCIYTYGLILLGESPKETGSFVIADYFTGDEIFSVDYDNSSTDEKDWSYNQRPIYSKEVEKYKN